MGNEDQGNVPLQQVLNCRQGRQNAGIVGDVAILDRHVEIHPHEDLFPSDVHILNKLFLQIRHAYSLSPIYFATSFKRQV